MLFHSRNLWWPFLKANRSAATLVVASGFVASAGNLLVPLCIANFLQLSLQAAGNRTRALTLLGFSPAQTLSSFFLFFGAVLVLRFLAAWLYGYRSAMLGDAFTAMLRRQAVQQALTRRAAEDGADERWLLAMAGELKTLERLLTKGVLGFVRNLLFLLLGGYLLVALAPGLTAALLAGLVLLYLVQHRYSQTLAPLWRQHRRAQRRLLRLTLSTDESNASPDASERRFNRRIAAWQQASRPLRRRQALFRAATPLLLHGLLALLFLGLATGRSGTGLQPADTLAYVLLLLTLFPVLRDVLRIGAVWVAGAVAGARWMKMAAPSTAVSTQGSNAAV